MHGFNNLSQDVNIQTLFQDETCRQIKRFGTHHGNIIDSPADGKSTYIPTWKEQRHYNMRIGADSQLRAYTISIIRDDHDAGIVTRPEDGIVEWW
jgi:hypothetical protein